MINSDEWKFWKLLCFKLGSWIQVGAPILCTVFGVIATYPTDEGFASKRPIVHHFYAMINEGLIYIFALLLVIYLFSFLLKGHGDPWVASKLQFVLDKYKDKAFVKKESPDPADYHRVTLFKYKRNVFFPRHWSAAGTFWPFGGGRHPFLSSYLVPVMRSGKFSKKTKSIFFVSDSAEEAEGVAGWAWATEEAVVVTGLPSIGGNNRNRDLKAYAESTMSDEAMIEAILAQKKTSRRSPPLPRAIVAIPVERNNRKWGVVVLDSRDPDGIEPNAVDNYSITIALIGLLLERL